MGSPDAPSARSTETFRLVLASTSPQRTAILAQLRIAHDVVAPAYREEPGGDPLVHAVGKARSLAWRGLPILGVDTLVVAGAASLGKPADRDEAATMLTTLAGRMHEVVSGLCLRGPGWEELHRETTRVWFRELNRAELECYLDSGEWRERAGAYAIQGFGASLVSRIEGDYLNVVGLPAGALVSLLARRFPDRGGFDGCGRPDG
jgi:septum formation protein